MSALQPNNETGLLIDEFIRYAQAHLKTVGGSIGTTSLYPAALGTPQPGLINWTGFKVDGAKQSSLDLIPNRNTDVTMSELLGEDVANNTLAFKEIDEDFSVPLNGIVSGDETIKSGPPAKFDAGSDWPAQRGGFQNFAASGGNGQIVSVDLGPLDLNAPWEQLAAKFIASMEGFAKNALWDENAYRLGFGSDKILNSDGKTLRTVVKGDSTTQVQALKVLEIELVNDYKNRLVGTKGNKITQAEFDSLNNKQKAALISFCYNCGSLSARGGSAILAGIRAKNVTTAANGLINGPTTGAGSGKVYPGLVRRRNAEAKLYSA
jgi:GH24 family phage-related lysozyme (muramidase)